MSTLKLEAKTSNFGEFLELSKENEGLVFMGAGGDPLGWIKSVAGTLKEEKISESGDPHRIWKSYHLANTTGGRRDLLMVFASEPDIAMGKLCIWRLRFGDCSWLSDYVVNYIGQHDYTPAPSKPECKLAGTDANVFALAGRVTMALRKAGQLGQIREFRDRLAGCKNYDESLALMQEYVEAY